MHIKKISYHLLDKKKFNSLFNLFVLECTRYDYR